MAILNDFVSEKVIFDNAFAKLLLNEKLVATYMGEFENRREEDWRDKECTQCAPGNPCKKHNLLSKLYDCDKCIKFKNVNNGYTVFMTKFFIFKYNEPENLLIFIDCPPFQLDDSNNSDQLSDLWIRKITPFTVRVEDFNMPEVVQVIDLQMIRQYPMLTILSSNHVLELHNVKNLFRWKLVKKNHY